jgi:hypothetical protein
MGKSYSGLLIKIIRVFVMSAFNANNPDLVSFIELVRRQTSTDERKGSRRFDDGSPSKLSSIKDGESFSDRQQYGSNYYGSDSDNENKNSPSKSNKEETSL